MSLLPDVALVLPEHSFAALHATQQALLRHLASRASCVQSIDSSKVALRTLFATPHVSLCAACQPSGAGDADFDVCVRALPSFTPPPDSDAVFYGCDAEAPAAMCFAAHGFPRVLAARATTPRGWAAVYLAFDDPAALLYGTTGHHLLKLLLPALGAFASGRPDVPAPLLSLAVFENLGEPLAVYDANGRQLCCSAAFTCLLQGDAEAYRVRREAAELAVALCARELLTSAMKTDTLRRTLRTARNRYRLRASLMPRVVIDAHAALIHLRGYCVRMPSPKRLCTRLGLTEREAEVALLVAEGLTSKEIAARLALSSHTVRRHSERVLEKLGLHTRAGVALALIRLG